VDERQRDLRAAPNYCNQPYDCLRSVNAIAVLTVKKMKSKQCGRQKQNEKVAK